MSTDTRSKKRKSGDNVEPLVKAKKVKTTTTVRSAEKPAPSKSALKKTETSTITEKTKEKKGKSASKPAKKTIVVETKIEVRPGASSTKIEVEPAVTEKNDEDADTNTELTPDQTAALLAGFSSDEDSADEDAGIPISDLPAAPTQKSSTKKSKKGTGDASDPESTPGVVYISRIPHGFFEPQMRAYFSQFGTITHLRLARNKKTGKSQHHAFVEFSAASVADIVAKTMDKYLLFGHLLQCRRVPAEQVKEGMWKGPKSVKGSGKVRPRNRIEGSRLRKGTDRAGWEKRVEREEKRRSEKEAKLKELGYDFDMPAVKGLEGVGGKKKIEGAGAEEAALAIAKDAAHDPAVEETVVGKIEKGTKGKAVLGEKTTKRKSKGSAEVAATATATKKRKTKA